MQKSAFVALFAFVMLPFSACSNNSEQAAYMKNSTVEANAREAEKAEQEFAEVSSKGDSTATQSAGKRKPASTKSAHHAVSGDASETASGHASGGQTTWTVQLGAFKVKENAEKLTSKLKVDGFPVMMLEKGESKTGELYLVHLEPTPNKAEAEKWQSDLKLKSFESTLTKVR